MSMKRCIGCGELHDGPHARCGECYEEVKDYVKMVKRRGQS